MSVSFLLESIAEPTTPLTPQSLQDQNRQFTGTAGVSQGNQRTGLVPAFMDNDTGCIYLSHFANGSPAPIHLLDGLPDHLILRRSAGGRVLAVKETVEAGFVRDGRFYTRIQAATAAIQG